jgi:hypothetical protein
LARDGCFAQGLHEDGMHEQVCLEWVE